MSPQVRLIFVIGCRKYSAQHCPVPLRHFDSAAAQTAFAVVSSYSARRASVAVSCNTSDATRDCASYPESMDE